MYKAAAAADEAFEDKDTGDVEFEPILGSSDPIIPAGVTTPTQDGSSRPIRVWKPVSKLVQVSRASQTVLPWHKLVNKCWV